MRGRVTPGNRTEISIPAWEAPRREVAQVLGLHAVIQAPMFQHSGLRAGWGAGGDFGAEGYYEHGPMEPLQFFVGAEAIRLAATRNAERRQYDPATAEQVLFSPLGAM